MTFSDEESGAGKQYTGQQKEFVSTLGAYYYNARFYSTTLGTFMSADTLTTDGLNRYAYVRGNPLRYNDPSGLCVQRPDDTWMSCTKDDQVRYFSCSWGGECNTHGLATDDDMRRYARAVIDTLPFRFFTALVPKYTVNRTFRGKIHDLARFVGRPITTGTVEFTVALDPTSRSIVGADHSFVPGKGWTIPVGCKFGLPCLGKFRIFEGWKLDESTSYTTYLPTVAEFHMRAGPKEVSNPFTFTGLYAAIDYTVRMESGHPVDAVPSLDVQGPGPIDQLPPLNVSLALVETNIAVTSD